jgi:hypothetical protein
VVTARQQTANRLNATRSTGPRTPAGKTRAKHNAVAHGLRAVSPVLPGEDPAAWEAFCAAVRAELNPAGPLEAEVANRVATLAWRLRRVTAFEVAAAVGPPDPLPDTPPRLGWVDTRDVKFHPSDLASIERTLADARRRLALHARMAGEDAAGRLAAADALFLLDTAARSVEWSRPFPEVTFPDIDSGPTADDPSDKPPADTAPETADDTTPETADDTAPETADDAPDVMASRDPTFLTAIGVPAAFHAAPERWFDWTVGVVRAGFARLAVGGVLTPEQLIGELAEADLPWLEARVAERKAKGDHLTAAAQGPTAIPPDAALEAILRYEPHLGKQLSQALDQLERVRALRRGR